MAELSTYIKVYGIFLLVMLPLIAIIVDCSCRIYRMLRYGEED